MILKNKGTKYGIILLLLILALTGANLLFGSVNIPAEAVWYILTGNEVEKASWSFIVWESRLPQAVTALLCGMALASSGLMLQTTFNNPLADPSILGISSGASLGVALVMLAGAGTITAGVFTLSGFISVIIGAFIGSMLVMGIILFFSTLIKNKHYAAYYRYHDRIHHLICHLPAQLFLHGRRSAFLHDLGNGKLWRSIFTTASLFLSGYSDRAADYHTLDKTPECLAARHTRMPKPGSTFAVHATCCLSPPEY